MRRLDLIPIVIPGRDEEMATLMHGEPVNGLGVTVNLDHPNYFLLEDDVWCATHLSTGRALATGLTAEEAAQIVKAVAPLLQWEGMTLAQFLDVPVEVRRRIKAVVDALRPGPLAPVLPIKGGLR